MSADKLLSTLRPWAWLLALVTVAGGALGFVVASSRPPVYQSETTVLVGPVLGEVDALRAASQATPTYAELVTAAPALADVSTTLGIPVAVLRDSLTVTPNSETRLITITAHSGSPASAKRIADAVSDRFVQTTVDGSPAPVGQLRVVAPAQADLEQAPRYISLQIAFAAFCALAVSAGLVLLRERTRRTMRTDGELAERTGLPVLAHVPGSRGMLPALEAPRSEPAAAYRLLAAHIAFADRAEPVRSGPDRAAPVELVAVCGTSERDAAGQVAANAAVALCQAGHRVLLLDVAGEGEPFVPFRPRGAATPAALVLTPFEDGIRVRPVAPADVSVPPAYPSPEAAADWLDSVRGDADVVVVTTGGLASSTGPLVWVAACDAALLVVRAARSDARRVVAAAEGLRLAGPRLVGCVVTDQGRRGRVPAVPGVRAPEPAPRHHAGSHDDAFGGGAPPTDPVRSPTPPAPRGRP